MRQKDADKSRIYILVSGNRERPVLFTVGGDLAPSLGDGEKFRGPRFLNDVFFRKKFLFSRPKFLMTFLKSSFTFSISLLCVMSYKTLSSREKHIFQKIISLLSLHLFLLCSSFHAHPTNTRPTSQNIGEDGYMGRPPPHFLGGPSPQFP